MNRESAQAGNSGGFTLIEVMVAVLILVVVSLAVIQLQHAIGRSTLSINDKTFGTMKAVQIMEELRTKTSNATQGTLVALNDYDDHGAYNPNLTIENIASPATPVSGNRRTPNGGWMYYRTIKVEALPDDLYARRVYVSVFKSSGAGDSGPVLLSQTVGLFRDLNPAREYGQYYDLYLLKPENVIPGDGPGRASHSHQMVQAQVADVMNRNPGLHIRLKPITRVSYGRDPLYMPYTTRNLSMAALNPIPGIYFYPGYDNPYNNRGQITAEDVRGRINIDGTPTNVASYALADRYNHAVRYPELLRLKSVYGHTGENQVPSWHEILEDMVSNPAKYKNAMFMNLLGNNFFMPPLRNYSDPCREPVSYPNVRLVSHPENLEYADGANIKLRVHGFTTNPALFPTTATIPTATVFIRGNSSVTKVEKIIGNASVPYAIHTVTTVSSQCTIQPGYTAPDGTVGTLITLYNTPIRHDSIIVGTPTFTDDWMDCVVGNEQPPYGTLTQHTVSSLTASGSQDGNLAGNADACHLVYKHLLGSNATIYAMITHFEGQWGEVSLTIRESTAPGARGVRIGYMTRGPGIVDGCVGYRRKNTNDDWEGLDTDGNCKTWLIDSSNYRTVLWRMARRNRTFYFSFLLNGTWELAYLPYTFTTFSTSAVVGFLLKGGWNTATANISSITIVGTTQGKLDTSGTLGLPAARRLYGMEYIPCPVGTAGFNTLADGGDCAKNTARWIITVNPSYDWDIDGDGTTDGLVEFQTRIGTNLSAGTTSYQPYNISRTYAWLQGRAPFTERFQFNGDPRYCPYLDVKLNHGYNWYFCAVPPTDGYTGYTYAQNGWATPNVIAAGEPRLDCDGARYAQLLRRGMLNSRVIFCTLMHEFGMRLLFGGETWMTAAKSRPWSQTGTGSADITSSEEHYDAASAYTHLRLIASTTAALPPAWYAKPWLGELFPDQQYTVWTATGNLPTGRFWRARYTQCDSSWFTYNRACWGAGFGESVLNTLPTYTQPGGSFVGTYGHWTDFDSGPGYNADGNPHPRSLAGATPALNLVQSAFNMVLITTEQVRCPIALNSRVNHVNSVGETMSGASYYPPGWTAYAVDRTTAEIVDINGKRRMFYNYNWGGGVTDYDRDFYSNFTATLTHGTSVCHMVLSGLSHHTAIAHGAFAKAQLLQTINALFDGGLLTGPKKIRQQPSVLITSPTVGTEFRRSQTGAIQISWNPNRWVRWDGLDYNSDYTALYHNNPYTDNTVMLEYKVMYSPNGSSWYLCDSPSYPLTTAGSRTDRNVTKPNAATAAPTSYTWTLPTPMPSGMYWIRVECYSYDRWPHYSYDQIQIKIRQ